MSQTVSKSCERCQTLPEKLELEGPGRLFLWLPLGHSYGKLVRQLMDSGREHQAMPEDRCVVVVRVPWASTAVVSGAFARRSSAKLPSSAFPVPWWAWRGAANWLYSKASVIATRLPTPLCGPMRFFPSRR